MVTPVQPVGSQRALLGIAVVLILFTSCVALIFGLMDLVDRAWSWEDEWNGDDWSRERITSWHWVLAGGFNLAAFGLGITAGALAFRGSHFPVVMAGGLVLLTSALAEAYLTGPTETAYFLIMALTVVGLLAIARRAFYPRGGPLPPRGLPDPGAMYGRVEGVQGGVRRG